MVKGPIDIGELPLRNERALDGYYKKTNHYIIIKPNTAIPLDTPRGVLLSRVGNICKGAATYEVVLQWNIREDEIRPYPFSLIVPDFYIEDDYGYNMFSDGVYNFDARVIGVMTTP